MKKTKILVTGGAGYIGGHTCKRLHSMGYEPIVIDNLSTGHKWAVKWGPLVEGDVANENLIKSIIKQYSIDTVIHFAANAYVRESVENPRKYYKNNVLGTINLLNAVLDAGVKHFVFSSSCAAYGIPKNMPITEEHPCRPINPYGESKLFIENVLKWYGKVYKLNWLALRYFNAAGADPDVVIGEEHDPETHLIPLTIKSVLGDHPALKVYGTDYPTKDGTTIRDYIHVSDLAKAHVLAIHYLKNGGESTSMNLGTGNGSSVYDIIKAVEEISNLPVPYKKGEMRQGDPPILVACAEKSNRLLNWHPEYKNIKSIIKTAWNWHAEKTT
jgi:UDP-arabinose 4-epimerase